MQLLYYGITRLKLPKHTVVSVKIYSSLGKEMHGAAAELAVLQ